MAQLCLRFARGGAGGGIGRAAIMSVGRSTRSLAASSLCSPFTRSLSTDSGAKSPPEEVDSSSSPSAGDSSTSTLDISNFESLQKDLESTQLTHDASPHDSSASAAAASPPTTAEEVVGEDATAQQNFPPRVQPETYSKGRLLFPYVASKVPQVVKDLPRSQKEIDQQRRLDWIVPKHFRVRPTECVHCVLEKQEKLGEKPNEFYGINKLNVRLLTNYVNDRGMILPRRITALCRRHQRRARTAIINARQLGLMPYTSKLKFVKLDKDPAEDFLQQELALAAHDTIKRLSSHIVGTHDPVDQADSFVRGDGGSDFDSFSTNPLADKKQSRAMEKNLKHAR